MAYQVKRTKQIYEELELLDEADNVVRTLKILLDADTIYKTLNQKYLELENAQQYMNSLGADIKEEIKNHALERIGNAVYDLYLVIFGEDNTKTILDFYNDRMVEMNLEITPFIVDVIIPRMRESVKNMKRRAGYKYNRKEMQKSGILRKMK